MPRRLVFNLEPACPVRYLVKGMRFWHAETTATMEARSLVEIKAFQNPLVLLEQSDNTCVPLDVTRLLCGSNARITVAATVERLPDIAQLVMPAQVREWYEAFLQLQEASLRDCIAQVQPEPGPGCSWFPVVLSGTPHVEILRQVASGGHDLVAKAAEQSEIGTASTLDSRLLRKCDCPVLFIRPTRRLRNIAVAVAPLEPGEAPAQAAATAAFNAELASQAIGFCQMHDARLHVVQAWSVPLESWIRSQARDGEMDAYFEKVAAAIEQAFKDFLGGLNAPVPVLPHFRRGLPEEVIPMAMEDEEVDLLVMGTVARSGLAGNLLGNTAESLLHSLRCSTLVLKPGQALVQP